MTTIFDRRTGEPNEIPEKYTNLRVEISLNQEYGRQRILGSAFGGFQFTKAFRLGENFDMRKGADLLDRIDKVIEEWLNAEPAAG